MEHRRGAARDRGGRARRDRAAAPARIAPTSCAAARSTTRRPAPSKMDLRNYGIGAQILRDLNVGRMRAARQAAQDAQHGGLRPRGHRLRRDRRPRTRHPGSAKPACRSSASRRRPRGAGRRVGIVLSRFNPEIGEGLLAGALRALSESGVRRRRRHGGDACPARWRRRSRCSASRRRGGYDALVALGAVIRGETYHFEIVANESAAGVAERAARDRHPDRQRHPHLRDRRAGRARAWMPRVSRPTQAALEIANLLDALSARRRRADVVAAPPRARARAAGPLPAPARRQRAGDDSRSNSPTARTSPTPTRRSLDALWRGVHTEPAALVDALRAASSTAPPAELSPIERSILRDRRLGARCTSRRRRTAW